MNAAALALAWVLGPVLGLATACGGGTVRTGAAPASSPAATPSTGAPAVLDDDRRGIPRVGGDDALPPQVTTRTTVLEGNRTALVVTLPEAVLFPFGSAALRAEAEAPLRTVVDLLRRHPGTHAEVAGHTDAVGSTEYNQALSERRAAAVVDWLVRHEVPRALLSPVGYGSTRPVAGNASEEERQRNRRVEVVVRETNKER